MERLQVLYALSQLVNMVQVQQKNFLICQMPEDGVKAAESAGTFDTSNMASLINLTKGLSESQTKLVLSSTALSDAQRVAVLMGQGMTESTGECCGSFNGTGKC